MGARVSVVACVIAVACGLLGCERSVPISFDLKVPKVAQLPDVPLTQMFAQLESAELEGRLVLKPKAASDSSESGTEDYRLDIRGAQLYLRIERQTILNVKLKLGASSFRRVGTDNSHLIIEPMVKTLKVTATQVAPRLGNDSPQIQPATIRVGIDESPLVEVSELTYPADGTGQVQVTAAARLGNLIAWLLCRVGDDQAGSNDSDAPRALVDEFAVDSLTLRLRDGAAINWPKDQLTVELTGATAELSSGLIAYPLRGETPADVPVTLNAGLASAKVTYQEKHTVELGAATANLSLRDLRIGTMSGQIKATVPGATIRKAFEQALDARQLVGNLPVRIDKVEPAAADAQLTLDLAHRQLCLDLGPISARLTGGSHKGHSLDFTIGLGKTALNIPLSPEATAQPLDSVTVKMRSGVRTCIGQFTGSKRVIVKVTLVKPIVVEPFDVTLNFAVICRYADRALHCTVKKWTGAAGPIRVGAIGDGPNAWATIDPPDAPHTTMTVNYVGVNKRVDNPVRPAIQQLVDRTITIPLAP